MPATTLISESIAPVARSEQQSAPSPVRLGILLDGLNVPAWAEALIRAVMNCAGVIPVILFPSDERPVRERTLPPLNSILLTFWTCIDRLLNRGGADAFAECHIARLIFGLAIFRLNADAIPDSLGPVNGTLDLILDLRREGGLLHVPASVRLGVWRFHGVNDTPSRHDYSLFWRLYRGHSVSEATLLVRLPGSHTWSVLFRSSFATDSVSLYRMENAECWRRARILTRCLTNLQQQGMTSFTSTNDDFAPAQSVGEGEPNALQVMWFVGGWVLKRVHRAMRRLFYREHWFVALRRHEPASQPDNHASFHIIHSSGRFNYADPFIYERNGRTYLFFEQWDAIGKGVLCCTAVEADGSCARPEIILARDYHLSYPQVFDYDGQIYLLPESHRHKQIELYRAVEFPRRWELSQVLMSNVTAVDPTLLQHEGTFWLFASGVESRGNVNSELFLFFSDSLFGPWRPHPLNPVVSDVRRARPAGRLFFDRGELIRPGQDSSGAYGQRICLNRVKVLSHTAYHEVPIQRLTLDCVPENIGTHTFNHNAAWEVLDGRFLVPKFRANDHKPVFLRCVQRAEEWA